jgi:uncharacterized membrane protein
MAANTVEPHKSSIGNMDANILALIAYVGAAVISWIPGLRYVAWLVPLVIFFLEKNSGFVKFHAMQAFLLNLVGQILVFIISVVVGGIVAASYRNILTGYSAVAALGALGVISAIVIIISIIITIFAAIALYNAYMYKDYHIPFVGKLADKFAGKLSSK